MIGLLSSQGPVDTVNIHLRITDGQQPVEGLVRLYWPDTGGDFEIGPTSDIVLPLPADAKPVSITVSAPGFRPWSEALKPIQPSDLTVRLIREP